MTVPYTCIFFMALSLAWAQPGLAQKHKPAPFFKGRYKSIHVSKKKAKIVCPVFERSKYPFQSIGVKIGDPFALTYKLYMTKNFAFALDIGSAASGLYYKYHRDKFAKYSHSDTLGAEQDVRYIGHKVKHEWLGEAKLLYHLDVSRLLQGLQWYIGGGWQARKLVIEHEYLLEISFNENQIDKLTVDDFTMGPVVTTGIDYAYFELPVTAFMEVGLFSDVLNDPGWLRFQGGVGIRYIF